MIIESRSSLYYGMYEYAISWAQDEIGCVRSLDADKMQKHIRTRMAYEQRRYTTIYNLDGSKLPAQPSRFSTQCRSNLESARAFLAAETEQKKLVFYDNTITVYTNDAGLYNRLIVCDWSQFAHIKQAELNLPPNTILLKNPQYQYRTYFRGRNLGKQQKARLATWIETQGNDIAASKSLRAFLAVEPYPTRVQYWWRSDAAERYYYIEHNSLQYETMLSMICPGLVRKTLPIVKKQ